jgi:hypothetical protein
MVIECVSDVLWFSESFVVVDELGWGVALFGLMWDDSAEDCLRLF